MTDTTYAPWWLIVTSVVAALVASVMPLPAPLEPYQPEWLALVVVYWCLTTPERFGPGTAWVCGIVMDALRGSLLGEHALALLIVACFTLYVRLQVRVFPIVQQSIAVVFLMAAHAFILFWVDGVAGIAIGSAARAWSVLVSALAWPVVLIALDHLRERGRSGRVPG